jgi:crotonobetainyl-CoA:carnitine CoA-transferase CaiB-like acyl-CoA transferase
LLRDQGAEVVKCEGPDGDPMRSWSAASPDAPIAGTGALFAHLHAGKASVTPPLTGDRNIRWWSEQWADVVLTERPPAPFPPRGIRRSTATPRRSLEATLVTIEPFGADGVLADAPASEFTLQAWCGLMSGCGHCRWASCTASGRPERWRRWPRSPASVTSA